MAEEIIPTIMNDLNLYYKDTGITFSSVGYSYLDCLDQNLYYNSESEEGIKQIFGLADHPGIIDIFVVS